jgi:hypothetical protein
MKNLIALIISGALVVSGYSQTRNVLVGTNNAVVQPTNFWSGDASNARAGLGLGSAATNPASAFQPSSLVLSNLSISNGGSLTNLTASSVVGTLSLGQGGTGSTNASDARTALGLGTAATNPATAFQASSVNLTNLASNNGGALTNLTATSIVGIIPSSNISTVNFSNLSGTLAIASGGTGATNAANARQNLGSTTVGDALFIATNAAAARTTIGATTVGSSVFTLANPSAITFLRLNADNTASSLSASDFRSAIGLGETNNGIFATLRSTQVASSSIFNLTFGQTNTGFRGLGAGPSDFGYYRDGTLIWDARNTNLTIASGVAFSTTAAAATTRTNLGLGLAALTNTTVSALRSALELGPTNAVVFRSLAVTNTSDQLVAKFEGPNGNPLEIYTTDEGLEAGYGGSNYAIGVGQSGLQIKYGTASSEWGNPVIVNTSGEVIRPTNFWQVAPITTTFIDSQPTTNQTTNIAAGRNLHIHSIAFSTVGITNTIALPTTNSFNGDIALVVHQGPTSSVTAVRTAGAATNLITLNQFEEAVEFVYYDSVWQFNHNRSFIEPIFFSGTNAAANRAASRTNLGLGTTNNVEFQLMTIRGSSTVTSISDDGLEIESTNTNTAASALNFIGLGAQKLAANTRTNLGLGATNIVTFAGLTNNGDITINQTATNNGLLYIRRTNNEAFLGLANLIASNNVTVSNETLFRVGVSEATNKAAQFGFRSTNTNGNGVAVFSVFGYNALMMIGPSDPAAGTNPIEATVYSVNPANKVMTLIKTNTGATMFHRAIEFENTTNQSVTRTNLGIPLAALTNTSATNFQKAIFITNTAPTNIGGNLGTIAAWIEIVASNGVTYKVPAYTNVP